MTGDLRSPGALSDLRRRERQWQDAVGHALLDAPFEDAGSALVFARQFERIREALGTLREGPLVEVGCGRGQFLQYLRKTDAGRLLVGVDVSVAVSILPERGAAAVRADGEFLPFGDGTAAAVVYNGALHHVVDYRAALREALRVLAPGGKLVLFEPVSSAFSRVAHRLLDPIVFRASCEYESPIDQERKHAFREEEVMDELAAARAVVRREKSDYLAYPFTGCYAGSPFTKSRRFMLGLLALERAIDAAPVLGSVARLFAWRFLVTAVKPNPGGGPAPTVPRRLEDMIACPKCKGRLSSVEDALACTACRLRYRVDGEIPVLLIDDATVIE